MTERKNRRLINMVISMVVGKELPKTFWPEVVYWESYALDRGLTVTIPKITLKEA